MSRPVNGQWPGEGAGTEPVERSDRFEGCRAEDLKGLLQRLSDQIADADRRHSDSMREMQVRLLRLGDRSEQVKATLPGEQAAALERIEDGMAQLAERLADGGRVRQPEPGEAAPSAAAPDVFAAPIPALAMQAAAPVIPSPVIQAPAIAMPRTADRDTIAAGTNEVPVLASAVTAAALAGAATTAIAAPGGTVPAQRTADGEFRHYPDEPWDQHSAAALARLYDSGEPGLPPRRTLDDAVSEPQAATPVVAMPAATPVAPALAGVLMAGAAAPVFAPPAAGDRSPADAATHAAPGEPAAHTAPLPLVAMPAIDATAAAAPLTVDAPSAAATALDREWLEHRLAEMAERVEASLADLKPDNSMMAFGERFDQFEQRFTSALDAVATRSDVEGLRIVEAHISELSLQLERAQSQLARLDSIESQFAELGSKLTDDHVVALFGGLVPTEQDLARFADDAAGKAADRVIAQLPALAAPEAAGDRGDPQTLAQVESLHTLLSSFIDERRRGEASTADALETMQLAMQQVLDRVDALETLGRAVQTAPMAPMAPMAAPQPVAQPMMAPEPLAAMAGGAVAGATAAFAAARAPAVDGKAQLASEIRSFAEEAKAAARATSAATAPARPAVRGEPAQAEARPASTDDVMTRPLAGDQRGAPAQPAGKPGAAPGPEQFDRARFVALARQAAEKAQTSEPRGKPANAPGTPAATGAPGAAAGPAAPGAAEPADRAAVKQNVKDRLLGAAGNGAGKSAVRPGMLLAASVAFLVLAGAMFVLPKMRGTTSQRPVVIEAPVQRPAAAPAATPATPTAPAAATKAAPAIDDDEERPTPRRQSHEPGDALPIERAPAERHVEAPREARVEVASAEAVGPAPEPASARPTGTSPLTQPFAGMTVQGGRRQPTLEEVMRARHRAHLATLSEQTAQNAALSSAVPEAAVPAAVRQDAAPAPGAGDGDAAAPIEMPPALVGPNSLRLAAQRGDASAQFEVAARFAEGKGIRQDFEQAFVWYQRAAAQGLAQAQYRLGTLLERGLGVKADLARARVWYQRAAEQGNLKAMHNLAVLAAGREQSDYPTASQWFQQAAERGLADSQFNLGILYESGLGVARDQIAALKWYTLAAQSGDREAARRRDALRGKLDAIATKEAEDAAAEWRAKPADRMANDPRAAGEAWKQRAQR